jgi:hypothetical protein
LGGNYSAFEIKRIAKYTLRGMDKIDVRDLNLFLQDLQIKFNISSRTSLGAAAASHNQNNNLSIDDLKVQEREKYKEILKKVKNFIIEKGNNDELIQNFELRD